MAEKYKNKRRSNREKDMRKRIIERKEMRKRERK